MELQTKVKLPTVDFQIAPFEDFLLVGSCFADSIGHRLQAERFPAVVNPYGVMYNPVSVLHTLQRQEGAPHIVVVTLGTNHVYIEKATGKVVDNCQKRPQQLFEERELSIEECVEALEEGLHLQQSKQQDVKMILTVSPIRYRKYGYHESQLSKATLLLAAHRMTQKYPESVYYFPAYEIMMDELRDYRFYKPDMLHPSDQAVEYIFEQFVATFFSPEAQQFLADWKPVKEALSHKAFHPESDEYQQFLKVLQAKISLLKEKYPAIGEVTLPEA